MGGTFKFQEEFPDIFTNCQDINDQPCLSVEVSRAEGLMANRQKAQGSICMGLSGLQTWVLLKLPPLTPRADSQELPCPETAVLALQWGAPGKGCNPVGGLRPGPGQFLVVTHAQLTSTSVPFSSAPLAQRTPTSH